MNRNNLKPAQLDVGLSVSEMVKYINKWSLDISLFSTQKV